MFRKMIFSVAVFSVFVLIHAFASEIKTYKPVELKLGQVYEGFKFVKEQQFPEFDVTARLFVHVVTGAEVLKLETDDNNKVFAAMFKTMPEDDSGVAHILEHSVLCGSKNYPLKKPFEILSKGSIKTYMNAETSVDKTRYPVASTNTKDFYNLMTVYIDAVFFPDIYDDHMTLKQEGWTYDLQSKDAPLKYNGIVFNEMKGSLANTWRLMYSNMKKALYPDIFIKNESGGIPESIVTLTQENFEAFHKKYYHPSNSYLYLYGDGNTLDELKLLQEKALKNFTSSERFKTPIQKNIGKMKERTVDYSIATNDDEKNKTFFTFLFSAGDIDDEELELEFDLIDSALFNYDNSPYKKAILDLNLCKDISSGYFSGLKQPFFYIAVEYADVENKDKIYAAVIEQLKKAAKDGFDLKYLESTVNNREYYLRRGEFGREPKGYTLLGYVDSYWVHANDPMRGLDSMGSIQRSKKLIDNKKLGKVIEKYLLNSKSSAFLTMKPKKGLSVEMDQETARKLAEYKATLSDETLEKLVADTKALELYKNTPDKPEDIAKIPMLTLDDLNKEPTVYLATKDMIENTPVLKYHVNTNNIAYISFFFDASAVSFDMLRYLQLATELQGDLDTENYTFGKLGIEMRMNGGGVGVGFDHYLYKNNANDIHPYYQLSGNTTVDHLEKMFELGNEIVYKTKFTDEKRILQKIKMLKENLKSSFNNAGNSCATTRLRSFLDASGRFDEVTGGIEYYNFIADLEANWETKKADFFANMQKALEMVWNRNGITVGITCSEKDYLQVKEKVGAYLKTLPNAVYPKQTYTFDFKSQKEGLKTSSKVQYVVMGMNASDLGYAYDGRMLVMKNIVDNEYLYEQVRVQGGAYGVWAGFSPSGFVSFVSYRDPNLSRTVTVYKGIPDFLTTYTTTDENLMRIKIGVISGFDYPQTKAQQGNSAIMNALKGYDIDYYRKTRQEVFATTLDDVRSYASFFKKILDNSSMCVYGNEQVVEKEKSLFTKITELK